MQDAGWTIPLEWIDVRNVYFPGNSVDGAYMSHFLVNMFGNI